MARILVTEDITGNAMEGLKKNYDVIFDRDLWKDSARLKNAVSNVDALIVRNQTLVTKDLIKKALMLKVIGRAGVGYDNIDVQAASERGIVVCYTPEENAVSVAEMVMTLLLALSKKVIEADCSTKTGNWERKRFTGTEVFDKILGILGLGRIGTRVALRAKAFGMQILACDKYITVNSLNITETGAKLVPLEELLQKSDFITIHLPLTEQTRELLDYQKLCLMKATAFIINTSRGEIIKENDLYRVLQEKKLAGAALDVREKEPSDKSPLNQLDNVILTPHISAFTHEAQERVVEAVCDDVNRVLSEQPALRYVNFPVFKQIQ